MREGARARGTARREAQRHDEKERERHAKTAWRYTDNHSCLTKQEAETHRKRHYLSARLSNSSDHIHLRQPFASHKSAKSRTWPPMVPRSLGLHDVVTCVVRRDKRGGRPTHDTGFFAKPWSPCKRPPARTLQFKSDDLRRAGNEPEGPQQGP